MASPAIGSRTMSLESCFAFPTRDAIRRILSVIAGERSGEAPGALAGLFMLAALRKIGRTFKQEDDQMPILTTFMDRRRVRALCGRMEIPVPKASERHPPTLNASGPFQTGEE